MLIQLFIPGKNWRLSLAELISFLEAQRVKFMVQSASKAFFVVGIEEKVDASIINDLGGTIKIGISTVNFSTEIVRQAFFKKNKEAKLKIGRDIVSSSLVEKMFGFESEKTLFGVSVYCEEKSLHPVSKVIQRFIGSSIKRRLAEYGKKSRFMGFAKKRRLPQLSHVEVLKKNLVKKNAEVLFCIGKNQTWISTTVAVHNPFEFQKRDVDKPSQRKIFAMSPRLARIMINLAFCTSGKLLLDPFCGVGTILQEALLAEAIVVGIDRNPWCVEAAADNLEWLKREYNLKEAEFRVLQGDAHVLAPKIGQEQIDCVATEPDLGPALRHVPTTQYAVRIIEKLEPLYSGFMEEAYKILKKDRRLVLVTPYVKTRSGNPVTMHIGQKAASVGFKRINPFRKEFFAKNIFAQQNLNKTISLVDVEERHKIGREIHVFQK